MLYCALLRADQLRAHRKSLKELIVIIMMVTFINIII
jgi:hypothetical protein